MLGREDVRKREWARKRQRVSCSQVICVFILDFLPEYLER